MQQRRPVAKVAECPDESSIKAGKLQAIVENEHGLRVTHFIAHRFRACAHRMSRMNRFGVALENLVHD
ncbi:MAG TPA: hypothetical protein VF797_18725 [Noviherbaspirillum sp.]